MRTKRLSYILFQRLIVLKSKLVTHEDLNELRAWTVRDTLPRDCHAKFSQRPVKSQADREHPHHSIRWLQLLLCSLQ